MDSETVPYISFRGMLLLNHGYVDLSLVGIRESNSVQCITDLSTCCANAQQSQTSNHRGDWFFPDGSRPSFSSSSTADIYQMRTAQRVQLYRRRNALTPSGIYYCDIPTIASVVDVTSMRERVYVGIYGTGGGKSIHNCGVDLVTSKIL